MIGWLLFGRLCIRCWAERTRYHWRDVLCPTCQVVLAIQERRR